MRKNLKSEIAGNNLNVLALFKLRYFRPKDLFDTELILLGFERFDQNGNFYGFRKKDGENRFAAIFRLPQQSVIEDASEKSEVRASINSGHSYIYMEIRGEDFPDEAYPIQGKFKIQDLINWSTGQFNIPVAPGEKKVRFVLKGSDENTKIYEFNKANQIEYYKDREHSLIEFPKGFFLSQFGDEAFLNNNDSASLFKLNEFDYIPIWTNTLSSKTGLEFKILGVNKIDNVVKDIIPNNNHRCSIYKQSNIKIFNLSPYSFGSLGASGNIVFSTGKGHALIGLDKLSEIENRAELKSDCTEEIVSEWQHNTSIGRDKRIQIAKKYRIAPFGHEATVTDIVERQNIDGESRLIKKRILKITQETIDYQEIDPKFLRKTPFTKVQALTTTPIFLAIDKSYIELKKKYIESLPTDLLKQVISNLRDFSSELMKKFSKESKIYESCGAILAQSANLEELFKHPKYFSEILFSLNIIKKAAISSSPIIKVFEEGYYNIYEFMVDFRKIAKEKTISLILEKYSGDSAASRKFKDSLTALIEKISVLIENKQISEIKKILGGKLFNDSPDKVLENVKNLVANIEDLRKEILDYSSSKFLKMFNDFWYGSSYRLGFSNYEKELRAIIFDRIENDVCFWPKKLYDITEDVILDFFGLDSDGKQVFFRSSVVLINTEIEWAKIPYNKIIENVNMFANDNKRKAFAYGQSISYYKDKAFETNLMDWKSKFLNSTVYIPQLESAYVKLNDFESLFNYSENVIVYYNKKFLDNGLSDQENPEKILFDIGSENLDPNHYYDTPIIKSKLSHVFSEGASQFSGITLPEIAIESISLRKEHDTYSLYEGLIKGTKYNPYCYAKKILNEATLLGLRMPELFRNEYIELKNNLPKNISDENEYKFTWDCDKYVIRAGEIVFEPIKMTLCDSTKLSIEISRSNKDDKFNVRCSLSDFKLGINELVGVCFNNIETKFGNETKPDASVKIKHFEFDGILKYMDEFSRSFISDTKSLPFTIDFEKVSIQSKTGLPSLSFGIFNLMDLFLSFRFNLYYSAPPRFGFFVSDRQNPFLISMGIFAGKGYFGLEYSSRGIEMCEASLGFGGYLGISFLNGAATGSASIMARIIYSNQIGKVIGSLSIECIGRFSLFGIVDLELSFLISGGYDTTNNYFIGGCTLEINVKLGFFETERTLEFEKKISKSGLGTSTVREGQGELFLLSNIQDCQWVDYAKSFIKL